MPSLFCPKCNHQPENNELFCCKCGTKLETKQQQTFCKSCGSKLKQDDLFCGKCGAKVHNSGINLQKNVPPVRFQSIESARAAANTGQTATTSHFGAPPLESAQASFQSGQFFDCVRVLEMAMKTGSSEARRMYGCFLDDSSDFRQAVEDYHYSERVLSSVPPSQTEAEITEPAASAPRQDVVPGNSGANTVGGSTAGSTKQDVFPDQSVFNARETELKPDAAAITQSGSETNPDSQNPPQKKKSDWTLLWIAWDLFFFPIIPVVLLDNNGEVVGCVLFCLIMFISIFTVQKEKGGKKKEWKGKKIIRGLFKYLAIGGILWFVWKITK